MSLSTQPMPTPPAQPLSKKGVSGSNQSAPPACTRLLAKVAASSQFIGPGSSAGATSQVMSAWVS